MNMVWTEIRADYKSAYRLVIYSIKISWCHLCPISFEIHKLTISCWCTIILFRKWKHSKMSWTNTWLMSPLLLMTNEATRSFSFSAVELHKCNEIQRLSALLQDDYKGWPSTKLLDFIPVKVKEHLPLFVHFWLSNLMTHLWINPAQINKESDNQFSLMIHLCQIYN